MIKLDLQALGESVLRRALEELQVWGLERKFVTFQHTSTAGTRYSFLYECTLGQA